MLQSTEVSGRLSASIPAAAAYGARDAQRASSRATSARRGRGSGSAAAAGGPNGSHSDMGSGLAAASTVARHHRAS
jgi:hypothetical protein